MKWLAKSGEGPLSVTDATVGGYSAAAIEQLRVLKMRVWRASSPIPIFRRGYGEPRGRVLKK